MTNTPTPNPTPPQPPSQTPQPSGAARPANPLYPPHPMQNRPGVPASLQTPRPQMYTRAPKPLPLKPRRVRGGVKISSTEQTSLWPESWAAQRWIRLIEQGAPGKRAIEGLEYASLGQTKTLIVEAGAAAGLVQGRAERAYQARLTVSTFSPDQWEKVVNVMTDQAVYAAKLLAGDLPTNIEEVFVPLGLKLFPSDASEVGFTCTCVEFQGEEQIAAAKKAAGEVGPGLQWCKHLACTAYLLAQKLASDPFLMFKLRGLDGTELLERLRHSRAIANSSKTNPSVYAGRVPGVSDAGVVSFEATKDFWELPSEGEQLEAPIVPPLVSHPLLRRLGPSPLAAENIKSGVALATFPLVGLLASCYEVISEAVLKEEREGANPANVDEPEDAPGGDDEGSEA